MYVFFLHRLELSSKSLGQLVLGVIAAYNTVQQLEEVIDTLSVLSYLSFHSCEFELTCYYSALQGYWPTATSLSVREHISGITRASFTAFLRALSMTVARCSTGDVTMRYVLPVYG